MAFHKVLIYSWGTRGDVQPPLALALRLKAMGKEVTMFVTPPSHEMCRTAGITCVAASESGDFFAALDGLGTHSASRTLDWHCPIPLLTIPLSNPWTDPSDMSFFNIIRQVRALKAYQGTPAYQAALTADTQAGYELAQQFKPDVIIHSGFAYAFWASVGEALGVPVIRYDLQPNYPTAEISFFKQEDGKIPQCLNKLAYTAFNKSGIANAQRPRAMELRALAGLSATSHKDDSPVALPPDLPELCPMSPTFVPQPSDWPDFKEMCGYWIMPPTTDFKPSTELAAFLAAGSPPVYVGFGSMKGNPDFCKKLSTVAITALAKAKVRGILLGGWAGLTAQVLDQSSEEGQRLSTYAAENVFELPSCPHDWLFPRCACVVHHGGAGTTAAGMLAGKPMIICAITSDQPWHGSLIAKKQLGGYAGPIGKVTGDGLGDLLVTVLADAVIAENAAQMGQKLSTEDGTLNAIKTIERAIASFPYPWPTQRP